MSSRTEATISGFNEYKNTLRQESKGDVLLTLTQFDTGVRRVHSAVPLNEVPDLHRSGYLPGGMTALYDAVGQTVRDTELAARQGDKVLVVIMTDGFENSSREWSHDRILQLLETKRGNGWDFIFLGAGEEAWDTGLGLGFTNLNSITYTGDAQDHHLAYRAVATATTDVLRGQSLAASMASNTIKTDLENKAGTGTTYVPSTAGNTTIINSAWEQKTDDDDDDTAGTPVK